MPAVWAQGTALCLIKQCCEHLLPKTQCSYSFEKITVSQTNFLIFSSSTSATIAHSLKRLEGCRLASEHVILKGWLEENLSLKGSESPLQQSSAMFALPWARQRTTSQHSACVLAGSPPPGPCTLWCRRTSTLACRGRWLLYSDQNLHKLKQKKACQVSKSYCLCSAGGLPGAC